MDHWSAAVRREPEPDVHPRERSSVRARERARVRRRRLFLGAGALFAAYYVAFWIVGIYSTASLAVGLSMAGGLFVAGGLAESTSVVVARRVAVAVAVLLAVGANASAMLSGGSQCIGFHTIWALPLIYGLLSLDDWIGSVTVGVLSSIGGLTILVNRILHDVIRLSRRDIERTARLHFVVSDVAPVIGDEARLGQVFLNLLVNAAHAVEQRADGPRQIEVRTFARAGDRVVIEVRDSGTGMPEERIPRIFEPFFTTKPAGRGTGLGLALCAEVVDQHRGRIEVESALGTGSVFRVVLPAAPSCGLSQASLG